MISGNLFIMFVIGFIIFSFYIVGLLYAIWWGHNSQREDMLNDPELRNYYSRHNMPDQMDYDGGGNWGRFPKTPVKRRKVKKGSQSRMKSYFWHKDS